MGVAKTIKAKADTSNRAEIYKALIVECKEIGSKDKGNVVIKKTSSRV